ncbi:hypothetical protein K435DRAFT_713 [Dendrothele bispora CBS 962.96]|uniref:Uncharacterized protein n=1 Tax=Dendrothele bispora (strain CBS 962.96) TaxID=1314807 RepID=A0A4S8MZX6_DENBC|nr:hypothetical protein K435DRAFT_713 [Dendrothele bispora CBS 962.96]
MPMHNLLFVPMYIKGLHPCAADHPCMDMLKISFVPMYKKEKSIHPCAASHPYPCMMEREFDTHNIGHPLSSIKKIFLLNERVHRRDTLVLF